MNWKSGGLEGWKSGTYNQSSSLPTFHFPSPRQVKNRGNMASVFVYTATNACSTSTGSSNCPKVSVIGQIFGRGYNQTQINLKRITMRAILQRVRRGYVAVDGNIIAEIGSGYVILVGMTYGDGPAEVKKLAEKTVHLRVFEDEQGKMNLSALDTDAEMLVISQFTLYADARKGRRPSFSEAAAPDLAEPLVAQFAAQLQALGINKVATGIFGAHMLVHIENDGPVTIILDTNEL
jgi:D-tyrosyl-tRNA(Tyr) deacylase